MHQNSRAIWKMVLNKTDAEQFPLLGPSNPLTLTSKVVFLQTEKMGAYMPLQFKKKSDSEPPLNSIFSLFVLLEKSRLIL